MLAYNECHFGGPPGRAVSHFSASSLTMSGTFLIFLANEASRDDEGVRWVYEACAGGGLLEG